LIYANIALKLSVSCHHRLGSLVAFTVPGNSKAFSFRFRFQLWLDFVVQTILFGNLPLVFAIFRAWFLSH